MMDLDAVRTLFLRTITLSRELSRFVGEPVGDVPDSVIAIPLIEMWAYNTGLTREEIVRMTRLPRTTVRRRLEAMVERDLVRSYRVGHVGYYKLTDSAASTLLDLYHASKDDGASGQLGQS